MADASKEFLTPGSMLTPGLAGGTTMAITNVVVSQFQLAPPGPAWVALGLSFLFGLLVWASQEPVLKRCVYYVLNSLVIFVVAMGSNTVGLSAMAAQQPAISAAPAERTGASIIDRLIPSAVAQTAAPAASDAGWCCADRQVNAASRGQCGERKGRFFPTEPQARRACEAAAPNAQDNGFFKPWVRNQAHRGA